MNKKDLREIKNKLENQKIAIEVELGKFAKKDERLKGDWDTKYPKTGKADSSQSLEDAADQVEEYVNLLPIEHNMELRLHDIDLALEKIKNGEKGNYGQCEKCGKDIPEDRLMIYPEARKCAKCDKKI
ncbi:MAG: hypothetical protein A3F95_01230 [Candidatus Nealsonbacteria bacterium RIFCSPLOWO2_12_FULL_39_31]|uniref:Zinc finger DksA/TraR C4-type domain-containing protein n=3 Tax=Candidatus Nealsoniibacteriota TaxID=1817911 RepID=A0A1G2EHI9_9BACT|nr:MAG: hypothetical protein US88_C0012G0013 [Parcubacteria group bacterium GW2011_GWA2_38_27]KKQ97219.1 MAG: hypothetical protein UT22_C0015G0011 [Parcubacteria group bacterium GW2011_GWC2_39_11]OGZ20124.1 MAG: hypothetical protein A2626_02135 [Candidatus Nealsonbacteria bacterium RIFCSPHIGHO2_01_FULL_38_55]OGZ22149.1 MAG: hypothetical protein A3C48_02575 [Candidatus Nealsonbacteria bacterium RIFCSPHIGHO2_02_FULL_38_75]OGZ22521.1 MAG: hypothetical protein A3E18_01110 [Candidatus Nealsonbacteri